ncbi:bifunctional precorrin-2 dehydrogenase/sirohydrochlorin ferrochelatase [Desulfosporosinus sp. BICA1-9]|uniref:precorrin-2 dehydrogenase/sirohydrochlorin ferrochelatase family protein n=1 Tax=Desulfosporosinus sp. BICA1-9 TaxID=1531958 RepID=UPI00054BAEB3|nr:bifunctional precorrin-2 dehydrogenase/sirohydrochlorin ferrochelatase [Desulfosporosinus sp. BICA1-9]KJS46059.1 MAG: precorrin-2 oxidase [Peptococcaceae bacterium BRH_c23]KJS90633.1 MAG: precorrin-2 oxidase [Desulfosporosinus sp. BICA1-9]HBW34535.1 bifunctional precorrin-2 dehydrogenase/sirohydrochlorin ferrochelatase [Desulfosporosinus sp.]
MSQYYPIFINLKALSVLVVGGGNIALRKVQTLLHHGALVRIVSPRLVPELRELIDEKTCFWVEKEYSTEDIQDAMLVFSCTEIEEVNAQVSYDAKAHFRPVNVVDEPEKCSFIVPSIMERGDLKIAVSTGGSSPIVARQVRSELEALYGNEMADYLTLLKSWRTKAKKDLPPEKRSIFWDRATDGEVRKLIKAQRLTEAEGVIETCFLSLLG